MGCPQLSPHAEHEGPSRMGTALLWALALPTFPHSTLGLVWLWLGSVLGPRGIPVLENRSWHLEPSSWGGDEGSQLGAAEGLRNGLWGSWTSGPPACLARSIPGSEPPVTAVPVLLLSPSTAAIR